MEHVNPEHLAGHALGQPDALDEAERRHLAGCPGCRADLAEWQRIAGLAAEPATAQVPLAPGPQVWRRISAALEELDEPPTRSTRPAPTTPAPTTPAPTTPAPRRVRRRTAALLAAAALLVGAGGAWAVSAALRDAPVSNPPPAEVLGRTALAALPGHSGDGQATLLRTSTDVELRVTVNATPDQRRYHELWLINADGERMYALGVLPPSGTGAYPLPPELADGLDGYTTVDVSIEPYDGNAAHSRNSLVRGTLS